MSTHREPCRDLSSCPPPTRPQVLLHSRLAPQTPLHTLTAIMSGHSCREGPSQGRAGLDDLPPDVLERIAELGFTSLLSPLFDRGDLLHQACTLACVGNSTCTSLTQLLFAQLYHRLGGLRRRVELHGEVARQGRAEGQQRWRGRRTSGGRRRAHSSVARVHMSFTARRPALPPEQARSCRAA